MNDAAEPIWRAEATLGEGVLWRADEARVYFVDIKEGRLHTCDAAGGGRQAWRIDDCLPCVAPAGRGRFVAALKDRVVLLTLEGGAARVAPLAAPDRWRQGDRFNDGACDANGRFWIGSMDDAETEMTGAFWRVDASGCTRVLGGVKIANGPVFGPDRAIYFTDSAAQTVWRARLADNGAIIDRAVFRQFSADEGYPDGMAIDEAGRVWIARWGAGAVTCYDADGRAVRTVTTGAPHTTKCAFGGENGRRLFIISARQGLSEAELAAAPLSGALFAIDLDVAGAPVYAFASG